MHLSVQDSFVAQMNGITWWKLYSLCQAASGGDLSECWYAALPWIRDQHGANFLHPFCRYSIEFPLTKYTLTMAKRTVKQTL